MRNRTSIVLTLSGLALFVFAACGGVQTPPQDGQCHEWREWVPPTQNADGSWNEGYCRDR